MITIGNDECIRLLCIVIELDECGTVAADKAHITAAHDVVDGDARLAHDFDLIHWLREPLPFSPTAIRPNPSPH
jgi:hypothetical protein